MMTVFELSNEALREFYVCASELPVIGLIRKHSGQPPAQIKHWNKDQGVFYNEVETLADETDVKAFMDHYASVLARTGWKVLSEPLNPT